MRYPSDISGIKFGRLTAICRVENRICSNGKPRSVWLCECECGNRKEILRNQLVTGGTKSCGCLEIETKKTMHIKHGMAKTRLWSIWCNMRDRCSREKNKNYKEYGGRGISVCDEWLGENGFAHFRDWAMSNGYREELTIDRVDNDGDYCPENCRWVTRVEQTRNRRNTIKIPLAKIAEIEGLSYQKAYDKYVRRIEFERAEKPEE